LPDLAPMAASVRGQIQSQREALERAIQTGSSTDVDVARELGVLGQLLLAADSVAAAEPYFVRASRLEPAEPRWPYYLGHLHRMQGALEPAAEYFDRALALRPLDVAALVWKGNVSLDRGLADQAALYYARALEQRPGLFAARFGLGRVALVRGAYEDAVTHLETALAAEPRASAVHYPLALAYRGLGRLTEAEAHLRMRGEAQPGPPDPLMEEVAGLLQSPVVFEARGDRALARGDMGAAVAAFRRGLELAPDRPAIKQKLATALALNGDIPAALAFYRQLLEQDPGFPEAHYSLGALFLGSGQLDLAIEEFAAAVRADPTYVQAHLQLAHTLRRAGRLQPALAAYEQTLSIDPRMADARLGYAVALTGQGRWGTARAWLNEGRRAHPERLEFLDLLIRLLAASPDPNVRDGRLALELGQDLVARSRSWRTLESTAMALAETGRYDEAVTRQREAMEVYRREAGAPNEAMAGNLLRYERREPCRVPWAGDPIP
jgi:tetratricopeptide (TPR) repeat protein